MAPVAAACCASLPGGHVTRPGWTELPTTDIPTTEVRSGATDEGYRLGATGKGEGVPTGREPLTRGTDRSGTADEGYQLGAADEGIV